MNPQEPDNVVNEPSVVTPGAGLEAEEYIKHELVRSRKALKTTQVASVLFTLVTFISIGGITTGFARSLQPDEAATIAKGLVAEHVDSQIPEFRRYIKEKVPTLISQVPSYVKTQLPIYRTNLENQLETNLTQYADQSAKQLDSKFDDFLTTNQADVKGLMGASQDPEALRRMDVNLKKMYVDYLDSTQINGETLQSKVDQSLDGLTQIDSRMKRLAANKNLTDEEKKTRKAIAILLKNVDTNPDIAQARTAVDNIRQTSPAQIQAAVQGTLQYVGPNEATFSQPGKAPVTFVRKSGSSEAMKTTGQAAQPIVHGTTPAAKTGSTVSTATKANPAIAKNAKPDVKAPTK